MRQTRTIINAMEIIRKKLIFKGRVQHVGFRYTARMTANALGLSGYAENLYNGDVLMEVEGDEASIDDLIDRLCNDTYIRVESISEEDIPVTGGYGFDCY